MITPNGPNLLIKLPENSSVTKKFIRSSFGSKKME